MYQTLLHLYFTSRTSWSKNYRAWNHMCAIIIVVHWLLSTLSRPFENKRNPRRESNLLIWNGYPYLLNCCIAYDSMVAPAKILTEIPRNSTEILQYSRPRSKKNGELTNLKFWMKGSFQMSRKSLGLKTNEINYHQMKAPVILHIIKHESIILIPCKLFSSLIYWVSWIFILFFWCCS